jgi:hypothetical protein
VSLARRSRARERGFCESPLIGELGSTQLELRERSFQLMHERFFSEERHAALQRRSWLRDLRRRGAFQPTHSRAVFGSRDPFRRFF